MRMHHLLFVLIACLVGCGPTRTEGTRGKSTKELAVLTIPQLDLVPNMKIDTIQFDGKGEAFEIGKGRDFYLLPGQHTGSFDFKLIVDGPPGWFIPSKAMKLPGPKNVPLGAVTAGKKYELGGLVEGFEKLVRQGELTLIREKPE